MSGVELGLAIVAALDLCVKYGKILIDICSNDVETRLKEHSLSVQACLQRTEVQLKFLDRLKHTLDQDLCILQESLLRVLESKIRKAKSKINILSRKSWLGKAKYALMKEHLEATLSDLRTWRSDFDPSWYLMIRMGDKILDQELAVRKPGKLAIMDGKSVAHAGDSLITDAKQLRKTIQEDNKNTSGIFLGTEKNAEYQVIPFSTTRTMRRSESGSVFVLDSVPYNDDVDAQSQEQNIRFFAGKLRGAAPLSPGLLACHGVVKVKNRFNKNTIDAFDFVFGVPKSLASPQSLRSLLLSVDQSYSLSRRLSIAFQLARAVSYIHTLGFIHKNIRPETILIFEGQEERETLFLLGLGIFRSVKNPTRMLGDDSWNKNIYRHPQRQGIKPEERYIMQHDIYSLGVCLLEIGLWSSMVKYSQDQTTAIPSPDWSVTTQTGGMELVSIAKERLPGNMGDKYTHVVVNCLTSLNKDNPDFETADAESIGVRYLEKVLLALSDIRM